MGISTAFRNSTSGLAAAARWGELTAGNIANASREGYVSRNLTTESLPTGGVVITGISREVDSNLDRQFRLETAGLARQQVIASALDSYSFELGNPGDTLTIAGQFSNLYSSFGLLSNAPADISLQNNVLASATGLSETLNDASNTLALTRASVSSGIENDIRELNDRLAKIAKLNTQIIQEQRPTTRRAGQLDERAMEIDALSKLMDINISHSLDGSVAITTGNGTMLVDGNTTFKVAYNATLGQLQVGNTNITPNKDGVRGFNEGQLAGWFELKDNIIPQMQLQLDEFAHVLMTSFEAADSSLATGQAGLFTDLGSAYDPAQREGLAGRLTVNAAVDPNRGGVLWRIRDGVAATSQGPASDSAQTIAFLSVFDSSQSFDPQAGQGTTTELLDYVAGMVADQKLVRVNAQVKRDELDGKAQAVQSARQGIQGVNLDAELQKLTLIEQSYAANAQVMKALTTMLDTLLAAV